MKKLSINTKATFVFLALYIILFSFVFILNLTFSLQSLLLSFGGLAAIWIIGHRLEPKYYIGAQCFLFVAEGIGAGLQFYAIISIYDVIMHLCSGILLAFLGEYTLTLFNKGNPPKLPSLIHYVYCFIFAAACAGFWEIWEFSGDKLFGFNSQLGSLDDTMTDIIAGSLGAIIGVLILIILNQRKRNKE